MLTDEQVAKIRKLEWEWHHEDCSDHQAAIDALLTDRAEMQAEIERLRAVVEAAQIVKGYEAFEANYGQLGKDLDDALAALDEEVGE
jgi:hypothetical protein